MEQLNQAARLTEVEWTTGSAASELPTVWAHRALHWCALFTTDQA